MHAFKRIVVALLLIVIAAAVLNDYASQRFGLLGIDFYSFWSIGTAQQFSDYTLGNPYKVHDQYIPAHMDLLARTPTDEALFTNTFFGHGPQWKYMIRPLPTPLLYALFAMFPKDFSHALAIYRWSALIVFLLAILCLGTLLRFQLRYVLMLGLGLLWTFRPVQEDLTYGNVNSLLLFGLAGLLILSLQTEIGSSSGVVLLAHGVLGVGLVFLTLFKPLLLLPCLLLLLYVLWRSGMRAWIAMGLAAGAALALCLTAGSWFFRSWTTWLDWYDFVQSHVYVDTSEGNHAFVKMITEWTGFDPAKASVLLGSVLLLSLIWTMRSDGVVQVFPFLNDAVLLVSVGILMTLATSPLVWPHYNVLAIIPAMWLASRSTHKAFFLLAPAVAWLANLDVLNRWLEQSHMHVQAILISTTWLPLWVGILAALRVEIRTSKSEHCNTRRIASEEIQGGNIAETN